MNQTILFYIRQNMSLLRGYDTGFLTNWLDLIDVVTDS